MTSTLQPSLITAAMLCLVFAYLWVHEGDRYLGIWAMAFALWTARYAYGVVAAQVTYLDGAFVLPALALGRATFILWGALDLWGRRLPGWWWVLVSIDGLWLVAVSLLGFEPLFAEGVTHYSIFGLATIAAGVLFARAPGIQSGERWIAGFFLGSLGALNLLFPFLRSFPPEVVDLLFSATAVTQLGIGLSTLLVYMQLSRIERERLHAQLEEQLTRVLSGYLPICAHCKSIRDENGAWEEIEHFVSERSDAAFSHSICPGCYGEHFEKEFGPLN